MSPSFPLGFVFIFGSLLYRKTSLLFPYEVPCRRLSTAEAQMKWPLPLSLAPFEGGSDEDICLRAVVGAGFVLIDKPGLKRRFFFSSLTSYLVAGCFARRMKLPVSADILRTPARLSFDKITQPDDSTSPKPPFARLRFSIFFCQSA